MNANTLSAPASGTHTRIQMQRDGHAFIPHGTVQGYDPITGVVTALMDFQQPGEVAYVFTPNANSILALNGEYTDQNGLSWTLVR